MDVIGVIPARFSSTRFEGKVLAKIYDKPLVQYVYENARRARLLDDLVVATDDQRVVEAVEEFGGKVVLTAKEHRSGSDRLKEVVSQIDVKVVVNIQGDEPLVQPIMIDELARTLLDQPATPEGTRTEMATIVKKIEAQEEVSNPDVVKVVFDKDGFALYFSRSPIPYKSKGKQIINHYKHIGLYAYSKDFLFRFSNFTVSGLEKAEKLEQLRALENGCRIKVIETNYETIGVDTREDLERVRKCLSISL